MSQSSVTRTPIRVVICDIKIGSEERHGVTAIRSHMAESILTLLQAEDVEETLVGEVL